MKRLQDKTGGSKNSRAILLLAAGAVLAAMASFSMTGCSKSEAKPAAAPIPVAVVKVRQGNVPLNGNWVGTLDGFVDAQIQPQVSGYLIRQNYREGSPVSKDQVLFQIDPRPFQAVVDQAEAQVAQAKGQLAQAEAQDFSLYDNTPYQRPGKLVLDLIVRDGRKGYHPRQIAEVIYKAITVKKPRARYSVVPKPLQKWLLTNVFPTRLIDRIMGKQFGLEKNGGQRRTASSDSQAEATVR